MLSHHAVFTVPFAAGYINYRTIAISPSSPNFPERQALRALPERPSGKAEPKISAVPPTDRTYVHGASHLLKIIFLL